MNIASKAYEGGGVMVALFPNAKLAEALALDVDGALPADELHVTLAYLGMAEDLGETILDVAAAVLTGFAAEHPPLEGEIVGAGRFTPAGGEHVVWAPVDLPALPEWRHELVARLEAAGVPVSHDHGFTPHMTLAYVTPDVETPAGVHVPVRFDAVSLAADSVHFDFVLEGRTMTTSAVKQSPIGSIDWAREQIRIMLTENPDERPWVYVPVMWTDRCIVEFSGEEGTTLFEYPWRAIGEGEDMSVELGEPAERSLEYVAKMEGGPRLTGPIVAKDAAKQIIYSAVLVPGEPDSDGDLLSAEKVEEVAHAWLASFRAIDEQHSVVQIDATPVESWIEPQDRVVIIDGRPVVLPMGTWSMAVHVGDDDVWADIVSGKRTGMSIMGVPTELLDAAMKSVADGDMSALKRVTLTDIGGGDPNGPWLAPFVSIVDRPAVPKAKIYALKAAEPPAKPGLFARWRANKEGRRFSDSTVSRLRAARDSLDELLAEAEQERATRSAGNKSAAAPTNDPQEGTMLTKEIKDEIAAAVKSAIETENEPTLEEQIAAAVKAATEPLEEQIAALKENGDDKVLDAVLATVPESKREAVKAALGSVLGGNAVLDAALAAVPEDKREAVKAALAPVLTDGGDDEEIPAAVKSAIDELANRLDERTRAGSRQPTDDGADGAATKAAPFSEFDSYGRPRKTATA